MQGRKPKPRGPANVAVLPGAAAKLAQHEAGKRALTRQIAKDMKRAVKKAMPKGLKPEMQVEFRRVATLLANPTVDRLKPHYLDVILEYCRACIRLRQYREYFQDDVRREVYSVGGAPPAPAADGEQPQQPAPRTRNGVQVKSHPFVGQRNETWRQWRSLVAILGLSPTDERNMAPGMGNLGDPNDDLFD